MEKHMEEYKGRLMKGICEYMDMPVSERSAAAIHEMLKTLTDIEDRMTEGYTLSHADAKMWADKMVNDDGTAGAHWTLDQTSAVAESIGLKFEHITDWCWWIAMNMMYSDYCKVAEKYGVGTADFYADMAKAFLFDKDGGTPEEKLSGYYCGVVMK